MRTSAKNPRRRPSRPKQRHQEPQQKKISADEKAFLAQTAINPSERIVFERGSDDLSIRALDLICPVGMGQRALIVSPPGSGKTTLLKKICNAVTEGHPEIEVLCALIDERPEEMTDFKRSVEAEVFSSSMDQPHENHVKVAEQMMAAAFKAAAAGKDVLILLDSLTRLSRVHNAQHRSGGRTLSGGVGAGALDVPRRLFGAARNIEGPGSITMIATVLVETGSAMDQVIFEEFKGTGNMELVLSRELAQQRIFPAIDALKSSTRRAELLFEPQEYEHLEVLRRNLASMGQSAAMEKLLALLGKYPTNEQLLKTFA